MNRYSPITMSGEVEFRILHVSNRRGIGNITYNIPRLKRALHRRSSSKVPIRDRRMNFVAEQYVLVISLNMKSQFPDSTSDI